MKKTTIILLSYILGLSLQINAQSLIKRNSDSEASQQIKTIQKRHLTPEDYKLWENIKNYFISDNGDWLTYVKYKKDESTLFLQSTKNALKYSFSSGGIHQFNVGSKWFACLVAKKGLGLLNLEIGNTQWISNVTKFEFSSDGNYLMYIKTDDVNKVSSLIIRNLKTGKVDAIANVNDYLANPYSNQLAYIQSTKEKKAVKILFLGSTVSTTTIAENNLHNYKGLTWNLEGMALAFLQEKLGATKIQNAYKIYCYKTLKNKSKLYSLDTFSDNNLFIGRRIIYHRFKLKFAPAGAGLYFNVSRLENVPKSISNKGVGVEEWKASDKELYPTRKRNQNSKNYGARLVSWFPETGKVTVLETNLLPKAVITNNEKYMLSYNPLTYEPSFAVKENNDLYLMNLKTKKSNLFLRQFGGIAHISPNSKYINYFKDKHWWVYDLETKTHTNITKGIPIAWHKDFPKHPHKNGVKPYGAPGWTKGDKQLIVYDKYDVWLISPKGKAQKITQGRSSQIKHRVYSNSILYKGQIKSSAYGVSGVSSIIKTTQEIDLSEGLTFYIKGADKASGYSVWEPGKGIRVLVYEHKHISDLRKAHKGKSYTYVEQSFNISPRIMYLSDKTSSSKVLVESNTHQKQFYWGHSEQVRYKGPNEEDLKGALCYPANYDPQKKYPMIVEVYEKLSDKLHLYQNPSEYSSDRLNTSNYTTAGYFMFYPDIVPVFNNVGMSAVRCVEAGVKAVVKKGVVDADHIGLAGHSFGGYETNFIISQSNLFSAAVAGAAVSDLVSYYHLDNMKKFEDWQYNFKDSFYENPKAYIYNSPIYHLRNVSTPLLLWAGKKDSTVDYRQSLEMYFGLRRLNKTCELLLYQNDEHNLMKAENQLDLTRRIKMWFDKYLKLD
ncbi:alpha/beta hydrolase family protein [Flavivirga eckloniae]|uniref:Peptidase S9 prolyl oligopeptidase catalytic domain-containing protein n=1 Tax=Flavivirga eckloniae TaxID=1803846 RepID=A0A2K9PPG6_9FLAO|nr:prolyl oligopeptidase family serine peptidase [Flavivirga eckloniae]AUP78718.1 hypothetical protein C1H87_08355 [Flavivirga eckloniae]